MKSIILLNSFFKKNVFPIIILFFVIFVALFTTVSFYGEYRTVVYARDLFKNPELNDSLIVSVYEFIEHDDPVGLHKFSMTLYDYSAFEEIYKSYDYKDKYDGKEITFSALSKNMINRFPIKTDKGRWLDSKSDQLEAVITGDQYHDLKVGDTLDLGSGMKAKVVGKIKENANYVDFTHSGGMTVEECFSEFDKAIFINTPALPQEIQEKMVGDANLFFAIAVNPNASESEKRTLMNYVQNNSTRMDRIEKLIENTDKLVNHHINELFPVPLFVLLTSTISAFCIAALVIKRSMAEHSKYFLIGCSKFKSASLIAGSLSFVFAIPLLVNIVLVMYFPQMFEKAGLASNMWLDFGTAVPIIYYLLVFIAVLSVIPFVFYKKYSPLDFYRRNL